VAPPHCSSMLVPGDSTSFAIRDARDTSINMRGEAPKEDTPQVALSCLVHKIVEFRLK
jgi:hypothetical protein